MTRYGKGTAINITKITSPDQINVINDNFKKIQTQLMGIKNYLEPIAQTGKEVSDWIHQYIGYEPPVSKPQMQQYAQKQITMGPEPPEEPEIGEVWFVTDEEGNVIAIRHWDGTQWVDDVDNEAVAEAIEQAQQEAEAARQQAQEAVDQANQATQAANEAIQQAQQGFDVAQNALTSAESAVNVANQATQKANEAIQQAQQGFDAAQTALSVATSAQSIASDAIGQAQTAFDNAQSALTKALEALDATDILSQQVDQNTGDISTLFQTASSLGSRITDAEGNISAIQQLADSLSARITDAEGNISTLTQAAQGLQSSVSNLQGDVSTLTQTANSLNSRLSNVEGDVSELVQTASDLTSRISDAEGNISVLQQTANSHGLRITDAEGNISSLAQTVNGIQSQVADIDGNVSTLTQIADSLQSRISDAEENINTLTQTASSLESRISDAEGDISSLSQTASSLGIRITNAEGNISNLQQTANSLASRIENAEGNISSLTQTVDGIQSQVSDIEGDVSTLTQTASSLQSRISTAEGNINTLTQTANSLTSQISAKADQSWVSSQISQLSNAINLRVEKDKIINQINISTEGILIDGKKIHITGQTTIDNAVIKDSMIESVSASKIKATSLSAISANLGEVNAGKLRGVTIEGTTITGSTFYSSGFDEFGNLNELILDSGYIYYRLGGAGSGDHTELYIGELGLSLDYYTGGGNHIYHNEFTINRFLMSDEFLSKWFLVDSLSGVNITGMDLVSTNKIQSGNVYMNGANSIFNDVNNLFLNGKGGQDKGGATLDIGTDGSGPRIASMAFYNRTYSNNANLYVTPNGVIGRITSARKYKEDIQEVPLDNGYAERILQLKPKSWYDKTQIEENGGTTKGLDRVYGLIAEDVVEAGLPEYALFTPPDENGNREVDGIAYDRLWTLLIPITKNHHDDIKQLKLEVQHLKQLHVQKDQIISELQEKIQELEAKII